MKSSTEKKNVVNYGCAKSSTEQTRKLEKIPVQMWLQVDPKAEANKRKSPYCSMGNNPISNVDPDGDIAFAAIGIGMAIGAAVHTGTHLATNKFSLNNWNWGAFAGSVVAGGVGGGVSSALTNAGIGGFTGGAITGGSSGFSQNLTSGLINGNLSGGGLLKSTVLGAGIGGSIQGIGAALDGRRFWDGAKIDYTPLGQDPDLPKVMQKGDQNCACATGEMTLKSNGVNQTQGDIRNFFGGDPDLVPLPDEATFNYIKTKGGLSGDKFRLSTSDSYISKADYINRSLRAGKSINLSIAGNPGHSVSVRGAFLKTVTKVNGASSRGLAFKIFDPARSGSYYMSNSFLRNNVPNVFSFWR